MMPELRVRHQPCLKPRRRPREAEGRKDHERHRRQQRQKGAQRAESERRPATDEIEVPLHAATGLAEIMIRASPAHVLRSEEHTSELQSLMRISYAVFCLKKKKPIPNT